MTALDSSLPKPNVIYDHDRDRGELDFICTVEWSWSSYHERINSYYLGITDTEVELWSQYNDESTGGTGWCCCVVADKAPIEAHEAAKMLLEYVWRHESSESSIGLFDMVSEEGLLDQDAVTQIGIQCAEDVTEPPEGDSSTKDSLASPIRP